MGAAPALVNTTLQLAERNGQRCAGPVLLSGLVIGVGIVVLSSKVLGETSRFSIELLMQLVLRLIGPLLVSVLAMALLLPRWLERAERIGSKAWKQSAPAAALTGALLMLLFLTAALVGGVLMTPRSDFLIELQDLLSSLQVRHILRTLVRCSVYLGLMCIWCQRRGLMERKRGISPAVTVSNQLMEGLMVGLLLKLLWVLGLNAIATGGVIP